MSSSVTDSSLVRASSDVTSSDAPEPLPGRLLVGLMLVFLAFWLMPPLDFLKSSQSVFPLFVHTLLEVGAILAALMVFSVAWLARSVQQPSGLMLMGCGFLAVGLIDFGHALSYKGMPDFVTAAGPEKAIQFWLAARYLASLSLLAVAFPMPGWLRRPGSRYLMLLAALGVSVAVYTVNLWFPALWPRTFVIDQGLTTFKVAAEYGVIAITALAAVVLCRRAPRSLGYSTTDLCTAAIITIMSELCLTLYSNVNDIFSLLGHLYKVLAYFFIYRAVFVASVREPYKRLKVEMAERREAERRIEYLAFHDVLTRLPNRELARDRLQQAVADARRHEQRVALVYLDLDNFKAINDTLGHGAGDRLLQALAQRFIAQVRESDSVCRLGGDEFLLVLKGLSEIDVVAPLMVKLLDELQRPVAIDGHELVISASAGVAMYPEDGADFDALLQKADMAMYRAKEVGRNTYRFFNDDMNTELLERLSMRSGLRRALEQGQFQLYYQPQVDLRTAQVVGAEALIRWHHPEQGLISPARFIPVAEESGLIVPIGDWVIEEACRQAAAWVAMGLPPMTVAVNLSAVQFRRGDVKQVVERALLQTGLDASLLELELTESLMISNPDAVQEQTRQLKALGVTLAIDDFGTGYSSLSYLKRFAVDKLKIDQSFVRDLDSDGDDAAIVRAIIQVAGSLGMKTIAEGVERDEIAQTLQRLGCEEAQGYLYARPMPAPELEAWLRAQSSSPRKPPL
ncbi:MAG TPA: EAL domain-containing protein [Aquabacterium sp.]|uniref:bifunctional diguanylate cyclase/phosphodiesterase n=1 Tax=Aquabacterium sp. TaxID=1872578 RepID=UPI002E33AC58|nr:EAL domain-containing protein [Aquabacterium sp.]HEX5372678.1 EAL domain-containing protein [Aquabacterium sp.]